MRSSLFTTALAVTGFATGCTTPPDADLVALRALPDAVKADAAAVAQADNQFAGDLYGQLAKSDGNLFFSPFSIATAFGMVDAGAAGNTDAQLRATFHTSLPGERANAAVGAMLTSLDTGRSSGLYTLAAADRLFGQTGFPFLANYLATTQHDYGAPLMPVDFAKNLDGSRATINSWVASQTAGKIPELFGPGSLDPMTVLVIANAILFQGQWVHHFDPAVPRSFYLADGTTVQVPMMQKMDAIVAGPVPGVSGALIGELPFRGNDLAFVVAVPATPDGLPALEAQMTGDALARWTASLAPDDEPFLVVMPKLSLSTSTDLVAALGALGVSDAFIPNTADLSGMDGGRDLYVASAIHKAVLTVDEQGAEAAAATGVDVGADAEPVISDLVIDRPFVFAIYDRVTGAILFMGRVVDPSKM